MSCLGALLDRDLFWAKHCPKPDRSSPCTVGALTAQNGARNGTHAIASTVRADEDEARRKNAKGRTKETVERGPGNERA